VIEIFHPTKEMKGFLDMTFFAIGAKAPAMRVVMTTGTLRKSNTRKFLER
jgi:hypothetical protein